MSLHHHPFQLDPLPDGEGLDNHAFEQLFAADHPISLSRAGLTPTLGLTQPLTSQHESEVAVQIGGNANGSRDHVDEDEGDMLVCGKCKQTFNSISIFVNHKPKCPGKKLVMMAPMSSCHSSSGSNMASSENSLPSIALNGSGDGVVSGFGSNDHRDDLNSYLGSDGIDLMSIVPSIDRNMTSISPSVLNLTSDDSLGSNISKSIPISSPEHFISGPSHLSLVSFSSTTGSNTSVIYSQSSNQAPSTNTSPVKDQQPQQQHITMSLADMLPLAAPATPLISHANPNDVMGAPNTGFLPVSAIQTGQLHAGVPTLNLCAPFMSGHPQMQIHNNPNIPMQTTFNIPISLLTNPIGGQPQFIITTPGCNQPSPVQLGGANIVLNISTPNFSTASPTHHSHSGSGQVRKSPNDKNAKHLTNRHKMTRPKVVRVDTGIHDLRQEDVKNGSLFSGRTTNEDKNHIRHPNIKQEIMDDDLFQNSAVTSTDANMDPQDDGESSLSKSKMMSLADLVAHPSGSLIGSPPISRKKLKCHFCDRSFNKNFDLQQHIRCHTGEKPFQCIVCGRAFAQKSNVKKHMQTHKVWPDGLSNTMPASADNDVSSYREAKIEPVEQSDQNENKSLETDKVTESDDSDIQVPSTSTHAESTENTTASGSIDANVHQHPNMPLANQNNYACPYCEYIGKTYFELKSHMKDHKREKVFKCVQPNCGAMFPVLERYIEHIESHKNEIIYRCHQCAKTFSSLNDLGQHQQIHSLYPNQAPRIAQKFYRCQKCLNKYTTPTALEHHVQTSTHHYPCTECNKVFPCERYLRRHLVTHGTGLHVCQFCNKAFKTSNYLKVHMVIHTGDKPFSCNVCNARFNRRDKLKRHKLVHDPVKRLKCPFKLHTGCLKEFNRPDKLKAHVLTHSGVKPYSCPSCVRSFSRKAHLREHVKSHAILNSLNSPLLMAQMAARCKANGVSHPTHLFKKSSSPSMLHVASTSSASSSLSLAHTATSENLAGNKITFTECALCKSLFPTRDELERHACKSLMSHSHKPHHTVAYQAARAKSHKARKIAQQRQMAAAHGASSSTSFSSKFFSSTLARNISNLTASSQNNHAHVSPSPSTSVPAAAPSILNQDQGQVSRSRITPSDITASFEIDSNGSVKDVTVVSAGGVSCRNSAVVGEGAPAQVEVIGSGDPTSGGDMVCTIDGVAWRITRTTASPPDDNATESENLIMLSVDLGGRRIIKKSFTLSPYIR